MPDLGNTSVFSQTDGSNNSGTAPSWSGSAAPSTLDDAGRALQGAVTREWNWRNYTLTATGTADAKVLTYSVAPAAYYNGQRFAFIANTTNTASCTLNVNSLGAKTIKSMQTGTLANLGAGDMVAGVFVEVAYNTSNDCFVWVNQFAEPVSAASDSTAGIVELATTTETLTGTDTARAVTPDGLAALWEQGADIASAGTISIGEGGYFNVTGTTTITDIDPATDKAGRPFALKFADVLTLTHNATTLILPGGANITTAAGDVAEFVSEGTDAVRCINYLRADGSSLIKGPAFSAHKNGTNQTGVTDNTATKVTFSTELFDTNSNFASSTFTPTVAGYYILTGAVGIDGTAPGEVEAMIYKNGSKLHGGSYIEIDVGAAVCNVSAVVYANGSTDYFELYAISNVTSGSVTFRGDITDTYFTGCLLRTA